MNYLKRRRSQVILGSFLAFSILVAVFPGIDLFVSRIFFRGNSFLHDQWWQILLQQGLAYFLFLSVLAVLGMYAFNRLLKLNVCGVCGRKALFVILVLVIGPGLIVNLTFKDHFGRARPRNVAEFGGPQHFTPAFVVSQQCDRNCSFSSGDAAGGFFSLALVMALSRRRRFYVAAIALGTVVSVSRIAAGAHFFSDTVVSFFVMLTVADFLFYYLGLKHAVEESTVGGTLETGTPVPLPTPD